MFFATDIANFLACQHIATLEREEAAGEINKKHYADPGAELLRRLGLEHEQKYLRELIDVRGLRVVEIPNDVPWSQAAALTQESMAAGADAIYQATFIDGMWGGRADFLRRVETPSKLGPWSYEVVETKLAKSTKARAIIQLCFYSDLVARIQGLEPERMHVVLGGGAKAEEFRVQRYLAYFRKVRRDFQAAHPTAESQAALSAKPKTYPEPVEHCAVCIWFPNCDERRHADDHLSLVAGITGNQRKALVERDVTKLAQLGMLPLPVTPKMKRIAEAPLLRIREQARVQMRGRNEQRPVHELLEPFETGRGLAALPLPSPGDLFLDFEGDPFAFEQGLEYLVGTVTFSADGTPVYESIWSFDRAAEKRAFQRFIERIKERRRQYPDMHIYHYAPYEPTAIKHLAGRHGICTDDVDELLRAEVFVDLFRVVRQGLRASVESYSIKRLEPFYGFQRTVPLRDATSSLQAFETVLALGDSLEGSQEILRTIEEYNRDDCLSAWRLRSWLETLRVELETKSGNTIPRPELKSGAPADGLAERISEAAVIKERLVADLSEDESEWTEEQRARWLLAQMLEWHRREDKSAWWEYFRLCDLSDDELLEDKNALGGLVYVGEVERPKKSIVHRYQFPAQDHTIDRANKVHDPKTKKSAGELVAIDELNRTIDLKRGVNSQVPHPEGLIPSNVVDSTAMIDSLLRLGTWVANHGIEGSGEFQAARNALLRQNPQLLEGTLRQLTDESPLEAAKRLALSLDSSMLPIQGPPGSGKTYTGAQMIVELVKAGRRVGITAMSHKVISNLLREVCRATRELNLSLQAVQKANECDSCDEEIVKQVDSNEDVLDKLLTGEAQVAAGTAWLWSREEMAGTVDMLFVDEAGQMSLANVLAVSPAAKSVVLLGDPQQLDQPQKGVHPPGAEVSALAHLLNGRTTIGVDQGLFLSETWRLHRDISAFTSELFYDSRLVSRPENNSQRLNAAGPLDGTGLRFVPVNHSGNQSDSPEEVARIAEIVESLLFERATWTNKKAEKRPLQLKDILVVAPYNAQVSALKERLPDARIGTVDKFQGQEAPVVFYSMATSTPEDAPRGMEFLYSLNRLNVATSRAQCVTVLVASPALFQVQCKTPRQIELANAFCRYLEMAQ
jgi:predicted RecB family nuclease